MADVRNRQASDDVDEGTTRSRSLGEASTDSSPIGVYDRPAATRNDAVGTMQTILLGVTLLFLIYILYQWLT